MKLETFHTQLCACGPKFAGTGKGMGNFMYQFQRKHRGLKQKLLSFILTVTMIAIGSYLPALGTSGRVQAAATVITSMAYFSASDGPVISHSGVGQASYGFVMPVFNGGAATWQDVASDLKVNVKVNGSWVDIDSTDFVYNQNWGNWNDGGFYGYWFTISKTTYLQLASRSTGVTLDYTLEFTSIPKTTITSMAPTQGPVITADTTGGSGFTYPVFNGNASIPYAAVAEDLRLFVKPVNSSEWISIDNNAASGWIYDSNFGQFTDGGGGYWFIVSESINVKLVSATSGASFIYTINYNTPVRNTYQLTAFDTTRYTAGETGAIGVPLPKIDGGAPVKSELDNFVYEIKINGNWAELGDYSQSGFRYQANGYNSLSDANQWGYFADHIYGLWFQPIQTDMELRIGYPLNGQKGGSVGSNYIYYTFIGNPDAPRPDVSDLGNIEIGTPDNPSINGLNLIWQDEFGGSSLNTSKWSYNTGYYMSDDPNSWGWGNNELEYYTDSTKNIYLSDGKLNITAYNEPKSFPQDPARYATYSSGKITTKNSFSFHEGRIDFRAKLPTGNGIWPALWMLPLEDRYGTWAASGEVDVMEAKGRLSGITSGALHFGGQWPADRYISGEYAFPSGQTFNNDYHVYSVVWENDNFKWYVDGKCFLKVTKEQWYSAGAPDNKNAPFDQPFYVIMNLAIGGTFDGGLTPGAGDIPATMQVDYVRVYKESGGGTPGTVAVTGISLDKSSAALLPGDTLGLTPTVTPSNAANKAVAWSSSNTSVATVSGGNVTAVAPGSAVITATTEDGGYHASCSVTVTNPPPVVVTIGDAVKGLKKTGDNVLFYVNGAAFADLHYILNNGGQINIAMAPDGKGNFTYPLNNLVYGDTIKYFFTYNPGGGALDTQWFTYIHGVTQGTDGGSSTASNVAINKSVLCSGSENDTFPASYLTDNNTATRWSSNFADDAWFVLDLGNSCRISQLILNWEAAYGKKYEILVSSDGVNFTSLLNQANGTGEVETYNLTPVTARYVKFKGIERALPYGYSLWEFQVMGTAAN
ncbi:discoidin domain-containing protein [Anaerocolumna xylanovorans]|uniref:Beta-glucanase, GH16 family n=1 Tax=Anaerocolumna xylanovorans DSM 12503 TaxID=1121345 RepID=A0A1M7Y7D9_9FIRM|nr:family 16 glycosylhydrolase [Anaerocolumna xylanovorans]SHO48428.1 Beta-glucanase, GH16 family [Anaerocolumna xylanovorans DSM 12503]